MITLRSTTRDGSLLMHDRMRFGASYGLVVSGLTIAAATATCLSAQQPAAATRAVFEFTVLDAGGTAVQGANVSVSRSGGQIAATGTTDGVGRAVIAVPSAPQLYRYTVRHVGYTPAVDSVIVDGADTISLLVHLTRVVATLDTVRSTARLPSNTYVLNADEIARSPRHPEDAYDALIHLRPSMLGDRMRMCPFIQNLWVNGEWQVIPPWTPLVPRHVMTTTRTDLSGRPPRFVGPPLTHAPSDAPLARIKAGHIAELRYVNCWKPSEIGPRGQNGLFVTLRPGIAFDPKRGSYVADSAAARAASVIP